MLTIIWAFCEEEKEYDNKDYWSQITKTNIIMKKFEILKELPEWDTETRSEQMLWGKWHQQTCSAQGCHRLQFAKKKKKKENQNTVSVKHSKAKHNYTRYACNQIGNKT